MLQSRDWDAPPPPVDEPALTAESDDYEPPPNISPYYGGDSTQRVASHWSAVASGHGERAMTRDPRDDRTSAVAERYRGVTSPERAARYTAASREATPKPRVVPVIDK